jgi:hypothetical protein
VNAARAGDERAVERLGGREPILARAQLVIAREQGYPSWAALVAAAEADVDSFVHAAVGRRRTRAEMLLSARPEIASDPWAALTLGRARWASDVNAPGGPLGWAPLLYVCHSCFETTDVGRDLLARGADPNAFFVNEYGNMSALYGAAGVRHDPGLTRARCWRRGHAQTTTSRCTTRLTPPRPNASGCCSSSARRWMAPTRWQRR